MENATESAAPTVCSVPDKAVDPDKRRQDHSNGSLDSNHEEVEDMDAGHQTDLAIQRVRPRNKKDEALSNAS